jgi:hypothetical protein
MATHRRAKPRAKTTFYARSPAVSASSGEKLTRQRLHAILTATEPEYRAVLGPEWTLSNVEGPTDSGETLITWTGPAGSRTLYAIAVTADSAEVRLFETDVAGMPEQPYTTRIAADRLSDAAHVIGRLYASKGLRPNPRRNPLDTSADGWVHWHGPAPDDVGNLGPGETAQTDAGYWYRQDGGPDAGKIYFQAAGGVLAPVVDVEEVVEVISPEVPIEIPEHVGFAPDLPPEGGVPIDAVTAAENPRLSYQQRKNLPDSAFALPKTRDLPLTNASGNWDPHHVNNAAARLSMMWNERTISAPEYDAALRKIERIRRELDLPPSSLAAENPRRRGSADPTAWRDTPEGHAKWQRARAEAQQKANATGMDHGLEANDLFKEFTVRMLPAKQYRAGHELRVEVVHPEDLSRTQPGHGPMARDNPIRGVIGSGGLQAPEVITLAAGGTYAFGASDRPDLIVVDSVTEDRIGYHYLSQYKDQTPKVIERWIGEDLISRGERTFKNRYGVSPQVWTRMSETERAKQLEGRMG